MPPTPPPLPALQQPLAFVDLETTGANPTQDRITEIGIVTVDNGVVQEWSTLVNPQCPIPAYITQLTGINDAMVADAPPFAELAHSLQARLAGRLFIAHNARFDYGFLRQAFEREGFTFSAPIVCTVKLSRRLYPQYPRHNLDSLVSRHQLGEEARHRALGDARLIQRFFAQLQTTLPSETLETALVAQLAPASLPAGISPDVLDDVPDLPGVYLFYGEADSPLWVGKSNRLGKRVRAYFQGAPSKGKVTAMLAEVRRIEYQITAGELGAQLLEMRLIRLLKPRYNRSQATDSPWLAWQFLPDSTGHAQPELLSSADNDFASHPALYGLYPNAREARHALKKLAEGHRLCLTGLDPGTATMGNPCFHRQIGRCRGACVGEEAWPVHQARLMTALARWHIKPWPFPGPIVLEEGTGAWPGIRQRLLFDRWCWLGVLADDDDPAKLEDLLVPDQLLAFDAHLYHLLVKTLATWPKEAMQVIPRI